jgi:tyrosyl-tRNA synthetase
MENPRSDAAFLVRNAVDALPEGALAARLSEGRQLRVKLGIDPTTADIHLGHTVVFQKLREFQDAGHRVVLIIGDYTARVGDPSGRSATRPVLSGEEIDAHARTYVEQATKVLRSDEELLEVRFNGEWLAMEMEALFRLVRGVTIARLLERDDFSKRYAAGQPISLLELLYPVMQGYDSVAVQADVELGGTDQTFNLLMGRDVQGQFGMPAQSILTLPLLVGTDGERKMSKSYGNHVGITEAPEEMFGKTMSLPDAAMGQWFELLFGEPLPGGHPNQVKRALGRAIVERFHGAGAAAAAEAHFDQVFVARDVPDDVPEVSFAVADGTVHLPELVVAAFGGSRSDARRSLSGGGVRLDGEPVSALDVPAGEVDGKVLQVGKRRFARIRIAA